MIESSKDNQHSPKVSAATDFTTRLLSFLSTASNEILGGCFAGLGVATYLVLGRVGLILIGVVTGIVLHATWESVGRDDRSLQTMELKRRKELGLDILKRLLDWRDRKTSVIEPSGTYTREDVLVQLSHRKKLTFEEFEPKTATALSDFVEAIIYDYVKWWYSPILPQDTSFPFACRQTLTAFILAFSTHLSKKRTPDLFLTFLTNITAILIVFLKELSSALITSGLDNVDPATAVQLYLMNNPDSSLANVLDQKEQEKKFEVVAEDILQTFLDPNTYKCEPVKVFLRKVVADLILGSALQRCSQAGWINGWIVYLLEEGEPEIMNAINAGVGDATTKDTEQLSSGRQASSDIEIDRDTPIIDVSVAKSKREAMELDEATKTAMLEAKRLSDMIAAEETTRIQGSEDNRSSAASTQALPTPTSSQSDFPNTSKGGSSKQDVHCTSEEAQVENVQTLIIGGPNPFLAPSFTDFDQLAYPIQSVSEPTGIAPLTLHNARVIIIDDAHADEKATLRSKPMIDYLLQIEPASSQDAGWMIARKYADFETLHEVLRRISVISGVSDFTHKYAAVPNWRSKSKTSLRLDLEDYLAEALTHVRLAESEGMKRFLEKDQALTKLSNSKSLLGFPGPEVFQNVGKGMLDVLTGAPKGAADGGKAIFEGVSGVFQKKPSSLFQARGPAVSTSTGKMHQFTEGRRSYASTSESVSIKTKISDEPGSIRSSDIPTAGGSARQSTQSFTELARPSPLQSRPSGDAFERRNALRSLAEDDVGTAYQRSVGQALGTNGKIAHHSAQHEQMELNLPPLPSEIAESYEPLTNGQNSCAHRPRADQLADTRTDLSNMARPIQKHTKLSEAEEPLNPRPVRVSGKSTTPFTTEETQVMVELLFALINELYTLSSVWNIRRTLLNAAKAFLLRSNNPSLESIRVLLQEQVINANTSDAGLASHLKKLRESCVPTEEELALWPPALSENEQDMLKVKARRLLIEKGMPPALKGIMGSSASSEALGRVFDSLQIENFSRGLIFALMLQAVRTLTH